MTIIILNYVLANLALILPNFLESKIQWVDILGGLVIVLLASNVGLLIIFFEAFDGEMRLYRVAHGIVSITGISTAFMVSLILNDFSVMFTTVKKEGVLIFLWTPLSYFFTVPAIVLFSYWTLKNISSSIQATRNFKHRQQMKIMGSGVAIAFILGPVASFFGDFLSFLGLPKIGLWIAEFAGYFFMSFGIALILLSYVLDNSLLFLQSSRLERLMVIHETGLPIYDYVFNVYDSSSTNDLILSGLIVAIRGLAHEILKTSGTLETIKFRGLEIVFSVHNELIFIVIAQKKSTFINRALKHFRDSFLGQFGTSLDSYEISPGSYQIMNEEVERIFGLVT